MYDYLVIRYGELGTKGKNKKLFIKCLYENIKDILKNEYEVINHYERIYVKLNEGKYENIISSLKFVSGISSFSPAYFTLNDKDKIIKKIGEIVKKENYKTFKVSTRRVDKDFPVRSMDFNKLVATEVLKNTDMKVDVHNPNMHIEIEIRKEGAYIFFKRYPGIGGFPLGMGGKALLLLSGGLDSPVAAFEMMKKGVKIEAIHFYSPPYTSELSKQKVIDLVKALNSIQARIKLYIVPFTKLQESIYEHIDQTYAITIMRRMMVRIAEKVAKNTHNLALVTGESIGQVASQTLESMSVINEVTNMPIIRPLATMDKVDIINTAKMIKTYDISIRPYEDCCTIFNPKNPVIKPRLQTSLKHESKFDYQSLIDEAIANIEVLEIYDKKDDIF